MNGGYGRPYTPNLRATFMDQIRDACAELGADLRWCSDDWIAEVTLGDRHQHIVGYTFAVNDSAAAELAIDKAAAAAMLNAHAVPTVEHRVFTFGGLTMPAAAASLVADMPLPVVVKPLRSSGGVDVSRALTTTELHDALASLSAKYPCVAVSPWIRASSEYRVVAVDSSPELVFRKTIGTANHSEWRHSSAYGAHTELVPANPQRQCLGDLAAGAMAALGLTVGAVDILEDDHADLYVIEVNDAFSLNHFSQQSVQHYNLAKDAYRRILETGFRPVA